MKKKIYLILILVLFMILVSNVKAIDKTLKIYDYNQSITLNQENELRKKVNEYIKKNDIDMILITVKHYETKTVEEYVKKFFKKNDFGIGEDKDTIIFVLDYTDDPILEIFTNGKASNIYTNIQKDEIKASVNFKNSSYRIFDKLIDKSNKYTGGYNNIQKYIVFNKISKTDYLIISIISFLISTSIIIISILKSKIKERNLDEYKKINLRMIKTVDKFVETHTDAYRFKGNKK